MSADVDLGVVVDRFQPVLEDHIALLRRALERSRRVLVVIAGAGAARRPDTLPFTSGERRDMLLSCLTPEEMGRLDFTELRDYADDEQWREALGQVLDAYGAGSRLDIDLPGAQSLSPSAFGDLYFDTDAQAVTRFLAEGAGLIPAPVRTWLDAFRLHPDYADLVEELAFARDYRGKWAAAPFPPVFVTADAVLVHRRDVLLIQRARRPGQGLWALPGGFLDPHEQLLDAALRELEEETGIALAKVDFLQAHRRVFDRPSRDIRGRIITHAFLFRLDPDQPRPEPRAADDAARAQWRAIDGLETASLFGDHLQIIEAFRGLPDR